MDENDATNPKERQQVEGDQGPTRDFPRADQTQTRGVPRSERVPERGDVEPLLIGSTFGPYEIQAKLGQGGMGAVYKAKHTKLKKIVALKVLPAAAIGDAEAIARFEREMEAVGKIDHPNIVRAMDAGEFDGAHFITMEFIEGTDLGKHVKDKGPLSIVNACKVLRQAAQGLAVAHDAGLIHRDIKPANMLLAKDGRVKLLDLGLARVADADGSKELTTTGQTFGTPDYMAPEQWDDSHAVDARVDLYALGCTLFYLLTGRAPYAHAQSFGAKLKAHLTAPIPDLAQERSDVSPELADLFQRLLAKEPRDRIQTAREVVACLTPLATAKARLAAPEQPIAASLQSSVHSIPAPSTPMPTIAPGETAAPLPTPRARRKASAPAWLVWSIIGGSGLMIATILSIAIFLIHTRPERKVGKKPKQPVVDKTDAKDKPKPTPGGAPSTEPKFEGTGLPPMDDWTPPEPIPLGESAFDKLERDAIPREERFDWQPEELVAVIGSHARRQWGPVRAVAVSPDGKLAATSARSVDGALDCLTVWDVETQSWRERLEATWPAGAALGFLDNHTLVDASGAVWDLSGPKAVQRSLQPDENGSRLSFDNGNQVQKIVLCDEGRTLVSCGGGAATLHDWASRDPRAVAKLDDGIAHPSNSSSFFPLASGDAVFYQSRDRKIKRRAIRDRRFGDAIEIRIPVSENSWLSGVNDDGTIALVIDDVMARLWDIAADPPSLTREWTVSHDLQAGASPRFSPDGRWLITSVSVPMFINPTDQADDWRRLDTQGPTSYPCYAFARDGRRLVVGDGPGFVHFFDVSGTAPKALSSFDRSTAWWRGWYGTGVGANWGFIPGTSTLFLSQCDRLEALTSHSRAWRFGATLPQTADDGPAAIEFTTAANARILPITNERAIATFGPMSVIHWTGAAWETSSTFGAGDGNPALWRHAVAPSGKWLATIGPDGALVRWDLATDPPSVEWTVPTGTAVRDGAFGFAEETIRISANERLLASYIRPRPQDDAGFAELTLYKSLSDSPKVAARIQIRPESGTGNAFSEYRYALSPAGRYLAHIPRNRRELVVTDLSETWPRDVRTLPMGATGAVERLAFSPDGRRLAVGTDVGVAVYSVPALKPLWSWRNNGAIDWVEWAPDGRHLITHNPNQTVYVLRLDETTLAAAMRK